MDVIQQNTEHEDPNQRGNKFLTPLYSRSRNNYKAVKIVIIQNNSGDQFN